MGCLMLPYITLHTTWSSATTISRQPGTEIFPQNLADMCSALFYTVVDAHYYFRWHSIWLQLLCWIFVKKQCIYGPA